MRFSLFISNVTKSVKAALNDFYFTSKRNAYHLRPIYLRGIK